MARVVEVKKDELLEQREEILRTLDVSYDELRARAEAGNLLGEEWEAWEELRSIAFLLGRD